MAIRTRYTGQDPADGGAVVSGGVKAAAVVSLIPAFAPSVLCVCVFNNIYVEGVYIL